MGIISLPDVNLDNTWTCFYYKVKVNNDDNEIILLLSIFNLHSILLFAHIITLFFMNSSENSVVSSLFWTLIGK